MKNKIFLSHNKANKEFIIFLKLFTEKHAVKLFKDIT